MKYSIVVAVVVCTFGFSEVRNKLPIIFDCWMSFIDRLSKILTINLIRSAYRMSWEWNCFKSWSPNAVLRSTCQMKMSMQWKHWCQITHTVRSVYKRASVNLRESYVIPSYWNEKKSIAIFNMLIMFGW